MKIKKLEIKKLHNLYNYNVEFNSDLTFLYGRNGSGKTTILNIIEAIVSGRIYELYAWDFDYITLDYFDDSGLFKYNNFINIKYKNDSLDVKWKEDIKTIKRDDFIHVCEEADTYDEMSSLMEERYPILQEIKKEFNYVYLPLNRNFINRLNSSIFERFRRIKRRSFFYDEWDDRVLSREERIGRTAALVRRKYAEATARVSEINDDFRNKVLKSLLSTNTMGSNESFAKFIFESVRTISVDSIQGQYFKLLDSLGILDDEERTKFNNFFNEYKRQVNQLGFVDSKKKGLPISLSLVFEYHEIEKMQKVIPLAQEMEEKKAEALERINIFVETMNSFIHNNINDKTLYLDQTGKIKFKIEGKQDIDITTDNLSSGEKQLLIFFANFVFNVERNSSSIFVVDEPELSLHLGWQKMFVEKALNINKNMQLIFATHAPEFVGKYRDKMFKLENVTE